MKNILVLTMLLVAVIALSLSAHRPRYSPSWTLSHTAVYGIDMNDATISTAEIRGQNGETLDNTTDGSWDFNGARAVLGSINLVAHENEGLFYENEAVTY